MDDNFQGSGSSKLNEAISNLKEAIFRLEYTLESEEYAAKSNDMYRNVINGLLKMQPWPKNLIEEAEKIVNRRKDE